MPLSAQKQLLRIVLPCLLLSILAAAAALGMGNSQRGAHSDPQPGSQPDSQPLGLAQSFNAFVLEGFSAQNSATEGRLAAGGDINLNHYSVSRSLSRDFTGASLISGGDIVFPSGRVARGDILAAGSTDGVGQSVIHGLRDGQQLLDHQTLAFSFADQFRALIRLSAHLASLESTGQSRFRWSRLELEGDCDSDLQIFAIDGQQLSEAHSLHLSCIPQNATLVLNVSGQQAQMSRMGMGQLNAFSDRLLFNFHQAEQLTLSSIALRGSVLAPGARVTANNGVFKGSLIARAWEGSMTLQRNPFKGNLPAPEVVEGDPKRPVWLASGDRIISFVPGQGPTQRAVDFGHGVEQLLVDDYRNRLLVKDADELHIWSLDRDQDLALGEKSSIVLEGALESPVHLNTATGELAYANNDTLFVVSLDQGPAYSVTITGLSAVTAGDKTTPFYTASSNEIQGWNPEGELAMTLTLPHNIDSLAYDDQAERLWALGEGHLSAHDGQTPVLSTPLTEAQSGRIIPNGQGGLWLTGAEGLFRLNDQGSVEPVSEGFNPSTLNNRGQSVADPSDGGLWHLQGEVLHYFDAQGELLGRFPVPAEPGRALFEQLDLYSDVYPPQIDIQEPEADAVLDQSDVHLRLTVQDPGLGLNQETLELTLNQEPLTDDCQFEPNTLEAGLAIACFASALDDGNHTLAVTASDTQGNTASKTHEFQIDTSEPLALTIEQPQDGSLTNQQPIGVSGQLNKAASLNINNNSVSLDAEHRFDTQVPLEEGENTLTLVATTDSGERLEQSLLVILDTLAPEAPNTGLISTSLDEEAGEVTVTGAPGSVEAGSEVTITNTRSGENVTVTAGEEGRFSVAIAAEPGDTLTIQAEDAAGNTSQPVDINDPDTGGETALQGRLLDANIAPDEAEVPVVGARIGISGSDLETNTDASGAFTLSGIDAAEVALIVDTAPAEPAPDGSPYAGFRTMLDLEADTLNTLERPIFLPRIDPDGTATVDPDQTTLVENPNLGVAVEIPPNTAQNPDGTDFTGQLSISEVPADRTPQQLPDTLRPGLLVTIQPAGTRFAQPVSITFPNIDNLPPYYETDLWSLSESGEFTVTGRGRVSADGSRIETLFGGVRAATWHFPQPPPPETDKDTDDNNDESESPDEEADCQVGSSASLGGGCLRIRHQLPAWRSLGQEFGLELAYSSSTAHPKPVINVETALNPETARPEAFGIELLSVGGQAQDFGAFVEPLRDAQRHAVTFDARDFPTGRYSYQLVAASHYPQSVAGKRVTGQVLVNNQSQSPVGAGWQIIGPSRLIDTQDGLLLQAEDGGLKRFGGLLGGDSFLLKGAFSVGDQPDSVTAADFNGDGVLDLAIATTKHGFSGYLNIRLGNGDGSFQDQQRFAVGADPVSITSADFNGDGVRDLATANVNSDDLSVLLGNGDGSFRDQQRFVVGSKPYSITAADFNGDGVPDLATANGDSDNLSILLGNGDGSFQNQHRLFVDRGRYRMKITAADFNGDGVLDLATSNELHDDISIWLGNGNGSFQNQQRFAVGNNPGSITAADFNGDGVLDLAITNNWSDDLSILLGNGEGTFQDQQRFAAGESPGSIAATDFNGDGVLDLATANSSSDDLSILLGNGDGSFRDQQRFAEGNLPLTSITAADFNGDGAVDLATTENQSDDLSILLNQDDSNLYSGPPGDHSTIERQPDGTFIRRFTDGSRTHFNAEGLQTSAVDPNGNTTRFAYDGQQRLISITGPAGRVTTLAYAGEHLSRITDPVGRETRFTHDAQGNLIGITNPDGTERHFSYDDNHLLTAQTDERGQVTEYSYSATGKLAKSRLPDGAERHITPSRTRALVIDPDTTSVENPAPAVPADAIHSRFTDGEGRTQTFRTDKLGKITERTDPVGLTTSIDRDRDGNPLQTAFPDGSVLNATYDQRGNLLTATDSVRGGTRSFEYEPVFNRPISVTDSQGNTTALAYDERGNLTSLVSPSGRTTSFIYNTRGLVTQSTDPLGTPRQFEYNAEGNLTRLIEGEGGAQRTTAITHTPEGNVDTITDAEGRVTDFDYDKQGRLTRQTLPDGRVIQLAYDQAGNLTAVTPPGRPGHRFSYNDVNLETGYDPPEIGLAENTTRREYNLAQQLTALVRPDGERVEFTYDAAGRLANRTLPADSVSFGYNETTGNLTSIETTDGIGLAFQWDGFLPIATTWNGAISGEVSRDFDSDFRIISEAVNADAVTFAYDNDSLLTQAGDLTLTRDAASGLLAGTELGVVSESINYNSFAEAVQRAVTANGNALFQNDFQRDQLGRIATETEAVSGGDASGFSYNYDMAGRLTGVVRDGITLEAYTYDPNSNRTSKSTPEGTTSYTYDAQDRLIEAEGPDGTTNYDYTDAGELQQKTGPEGTTAYDYDAVGNLRSASLPDGSEIEYLIDGRDRRVGKRVDGELVKGWLYRDQLNPVAELDGSGTIAARFVYGEKTNVPAYMVKDGTTYRIISDHLGSPRLVVNTDTGEVVQRMDYDAFGNVTQDTNPGFQPFGFAGGLYDQHTGLVRFGARDYDPETGRWMSKDPIRFAGGDTNLYGYVLGDPVNFIDPTGNIFNLGLAAIGAGVGAVVGAVNASISGGNVFTGALQGAAVGTTAGFTFGGSFVASVVGNAAVSAAAEAARQQLTNGCINAEQVALAGLFGAFGANAAGITKSRSLANAIQQARRSNPGSQFSQVGSTVVSSTASGSFSVGVTAVTQ